MRRIIIFPIRRLFPISRYALFYFTTVGHSILDNQKKTHPPETGLRLISYPLKLYIYIYHSSDARIGELPGLSRYGPQFRGVLPALSSGN